MAKMEDGSMAGRGVRAAGLLETFRILGLNPREREASPVVPVDGAP